MVWGGGSLATGLGRWDRKRKRGYGEVENYWGKAREEAQKNYENRIFGVYFRSRFLSSSCRSPLIRTVERKKSK